VPYELLTGPEGLAAAADAWQELEARTGCRVFQTYTFARLWYENVGRISDARPLIVVYREEDTPRALFPACVVKAQPVRLLTWLTAPDLQDYGDIVYDRASGTSAEEFVGEALRMVRKAAPRAFLYLTNVREDAAAYPALSAGLKPLKRSVAPYVRLDGDLEFDDYISSLPQDKKRHLRRSYRRLCEHGEPAFELIGPDDPRLEDTLDWIFEHKRSRFAHLGEDLDLEEAGYEEFRRAQAHEEPHTFVARLTCGGTLIAAEIVCITHDSLCSLVTAFDEEYSNLSPGRTLHYLMLREVFERGLGCFDLCWGGQKHKYLFTDTDEPLTTFVSNDLPGAVLSTAYQLRQSRPNAPVVGKLP